MKTDNVKGFKDYLGEEAGWVIAKRIQLKS